MIEQIAKHVQLLDGKTRAETFEILFNLGHIYKDFRYLLSVTHSGHLKARLTRAYDSIIVAPSKYTLKEAIQLLLADPKKVTLPQEIVYTIYKLVGHNITLSTYTKLQESLGYVVQHIKETNELPRLSMLCGICGRLNTKGVCGGCRKILEAFVDYRRDSFTIPINHFNFQKVSSGTFSMPYKDWSISRSSGSSTVYFDLLQDYTMGTPEEYPLPFPEYQKEILS